MHLLSKVSRLGLTWKLQSQPKCRQSTKWQDHSYNVCLLQLLHAQNLIFSMDIIKNIPIQISENLTKGPYFFKDLQILTGNQIFNDATKVSLKFRNSCRKLVIYGWYLGYPETTLFHIMVKKKIKLDVS